MGVYNGYLSWNGIELTNAARTAAYVKALLPTFPLKDCQGCDTIAQVLGHTYNSPLQDDAEWVDPNNPATYDFLGFYPINIQGFQSSTSEVTVVQSITAGGYNNLPRDATREILVQGVMVAKTQLALDAGMSWLKEALRSSSCSSHDGTCTGASLCYYAACPEVAICYTETPTQGGINQPYSNLSQASGVVVLPNTIGTDAAMEGTISPTVPGSDGFTFSWGVSHFTGDSGQNLAQPVNLYGPVTPQRTNQVLNPKFAVDTANWTPTSGTLTRVVGGPDFYGRLVPTGTGKLKADVSNAPLGNNVLQFQMRTPTPGNITVNVRAVSDNSLIQTHTFAGVNSFQQYSLAIPAARGNYIEWTGTVEFQLTHVILEGGTLILPYFDGDILPSMPASRALNSPVPEYAVSWISTANESVSRMVWLGSATYSFCGPRLYPWITVSGGTGSVTLTWEGNDLIPAAEQAIPYERSTHDVVCISGPTITKELGVSSGAAAQVEMIFSAATPYAFATPNDLFERMALNTLPVQTWVDLTAPADPVTIIIDPDCPPVPTPPRPPVINDSCVDGPGTWDRYFYSIPAEDVSAWSKMLPTVTLYSGANALRQFRARLTPNPFQWPTVTDSRISRATNPALYADGSTWANLGALGTGVRATTAGPDAAHPDSWKSTATAAHAANLFGPSTGGAGFNLVTAGKHYNISGYLATSLAKTTARIKAEFYNASNVLVGSAFFGTNTVTPASATTWTRASLLDVTAPATAVRVVVSGTFNAAATSTETVAMTMVDIREYTGTAPVLATYMDGERAASNGFYYGWGSGTRYVGPSIGVHSEVDPFSYCGEFILSYLPADAELVVDGTVNRAWASIGGAASVPASNLLYGTDGTPIVWPELTCGTPYVLSLDVPQGTDASSILVSLSLTRRD